MISKLNLWYVKRFLREEREGSFIHREHTFPLHESAGWDTDQCGTLTFCKGLLPLLLVEDGKEFFFHTTPCWKMIMEGSRRCWQVEEENLENLLMWTLTCSSTSRATHYPQPDPLLSILPERGVPFTISCTRRRGRALSIYPHIPRSICVVGSCVGHMVLVTMSI